MRDGKTVSCSLLSLFICLSFPDTLIHLKPKVHVWMRPAEETQVKFLGFLGCLRVSATFSVATKGQKCPQQSLQPPHN